MNAGEAVKQVKNTRQSRLPIRPPGAWRALVVCLALVAMVWIVFGQTAGFDFINYDDDHHVYANAHVVGGLNARDIAWAFGHHQDDYWHPLDFLSHMLDCQVYGLQPGGHHLTNVGLHAAAVVLLFLALRRLTGILWGSAFVAVVFAVHPLRAESVAWVSERKDMLHGIFFALAILAYVHYVRRRSLARYLLVAVLFLLGLMCKPTLMTLPFLFLLFDYWPLARVPAGQGVQGWLPLILEKLPLFLLSAASCLEARLGNSPAFEMLRPLPPGLPIANALVSCADYLRQTVWPAGLAVGYPFPENGLPAWRVLLAVLVLATLTAIVFLRRRQQPYLLVGWLWYLGMLAPMAGFVQAGVIAHADRYTYLPQIGLSLMIAWALAEWASRRTGRRAVLAGAAVLTIVMLGAAACVQVSYWRNSGTLFRHAIAVTRDNAVAYEHLGHYLLQQRQPDAARECYEKAVAAAPDRAAARVDLASLLLVEGKLDEAAGQYREALRFNPGNPEALNNLGYLFAARGDFEGAITNYDQAIRSRPGFSSAYHNRGLAYAAKGDWSQAIPDYREAIRLDPGHASTHTHLGIALVGSGKPDEAAGEFREALRLNPDEAEAQRHLQALPK